MFSICFHSGSVKSSVYEQECGTIYSASLACGAETSWLYNEVLWEIYNVKCTMSSLHIFYEEGKVFNTFVALQV